RILEERSLHPFVLFVAVSVRLLHLMFCFLVVVEVAFAGLLDWMAMAFLFYPYFRSLLVRSSLSLFLASVLFSLRPSYRSPCRIHIESVLKTNMYAIQKHRLYRQYKIRYASTLLEAL